MKKDKKTKAGLLSYKYCPDCDIRLDGFWLIQCECGWAGYWWQAKERYFIEAKYEVIFK